MKTGNSTRNIVNIQHSSLFFVFLENLLYSVNYAGWLKPWQLYVVLDLKSC